MKQVDQIGVGIGLILGIPMTIYKNPDNSVVDHIAYVAGFTLVCWIIVRFVGRFYKSS